MSKMKKLIEDEGEAMLQAWALLGELTMNDSIEDAIEMTRAKIAEHGMGMGRTNPRWEQIADYRTIMAGRAKWSECRNLLGMLYNEGKDDCQLCGCELAGDEEE